jgi:hypothetical protein
MTFDPRPAIGDSVSGGYAIFLAEFYGLDYVADRIRNDASLELFEREWKFNGCTGLPDRLLSLFSRRPWHEITHECCLPHDLAYAYADADNPAEKLAADLRFRTDLVEHGFRQSTAWVFYAAVRTIGFFVWRYGG